MLPLVSSENVPPRPTGMTTLNTLSFCLYEKKNVEILFQHVCRVWRFRIGRKIMMKMWMDHLLKDTISIVKDSCTCNGEPEYGIWRVLCCRCYNGDSHSVAIGTSTEIGGPGDSVYASVANAMVGTWSTPTTGTILSGEILKSTRPFQWNVGEKDSVTHLVLNPFRSTMEWALVTNEEEQITFLWKIQQFCVFFFGSSLRRESRSGTVCSSVQALFSRNTEKFVWKIDTPSNIDLSTVTMQPGHYGEGSVDACHVRALFVVVLSPKTS